MVQVSRSPDQPISILHSDTIWVSDVSGVCVREISSRGNLVSLLGRNELLWGLPSAQISHLVVSKPLPESPLKHNQKAGVPLIGVTVSVSLSVQGVLALSSCRTSSSSRSTISWAVLVVVFGNCSLTLGKRTPSMIATPQAVRTTPSPSRMLSKSLDNQLLKVRQVSD